MNKLTTGSLSVIVIGLVVVFGFIAGLVFFDKDVSTYVGSITSILSITGVGAFLSQKVERVQKQTNGTLSRKDEEIAALHSQLREAETKNAAGPTVGD